MTASLPLPILETLLSHSLDRRPTRSLDTGGTDSSWEEENWLESLQVWRQTLVGLDDDSQRGLASSRGLWDKSTSIIPGVDHRNTGPRSGDWGDAPDSIQNEIRLWVEAGLVSRAPKSSLELPAMALIGLAQIHGVKWEDTQHRILSTIQNPAPSVLSALLSYDPDLDLTPALSEVSWHDIVKERPWAHELFSRPYWDVSVVLRDAGRLPKEISNWRDANGTGVLLHEWNDPRRVNEWMKLGADPNMLTREGLLPEESFRGFVSDSVLEFHQTLQKHRTKEQARQAELRMAASALTATPFATTQASGLFGKILSNPLIEVGEERIGILTYIQRYSDRSYAGKERLTTLAKLLSGKARAERILGAEGEGIEKGLAVALGIAAAASDRDWVERIGAVERAVKPLVDQSNREELIAQVLEQPHMSTPDSLTRIMGPKGLIPNALEDIQAHQWGPVLARVSDKVSGWSRIPSQTLDRRRWKNVLEAAGASVRANGEESLGEKLKAQLMAGMMSLLPVVEDERDLSYLQVLEWMGEGVEPQWPTEKAKSWTQEQIRRAFPAFEAMAVSQGLDQRLGAASDNPAPKRRGARM